MQYVIEKARVKGFFRTRVIAQYATGDYSTLSMVESLPEFQVMSNYIGNKYFKKNIYKSMKRIMENNCA